jgi:DNA-binding transcriptional MerR regulator
MDGYSLSQLVRAAGVTERTVRYYVERRVLPGPELRGFRTTYTDEHLVRLQVIRRLRKMERMNLQAIGKRLAGLSAAELRALLPVEPAAGGDGKGAAGAEAAAGGATGKGAAAPYPSERWERVVLLPGLELLVRADGGPILQRLAREIHLHYGAAASSAAAAPAD